MPTMQQAMGERIEGVIIQLEQKASSPPQLMWYNQEGSSLRLALLVARHMASSATLSSQHECYAFSVYCDQELLANNTVLSIPVISPLG